MTLILLLLFFESLCHDPALGVTESSFIFIALSRKYDYIKSVKKRKLSLRGNNSITM